MRDIIIYSEGGELKDFLLLRLTDNPALKLIMINFYLIYVATFLQRRLLQQDGQ